MSFVVFNADIYYHIYGLWGNYLNKPICVEIENISQLLKSSVFANNADFKRHQFAKCDSLKRRCHGALC